MTILPVIDMPADRAVWYPEGVPEKIQWTIRVKNARKKMKC